MGFKVRGYKKVADDKVRDYSLFAIACEGTEREPEYFGPFDNIDRIKVDIIKNENGYRDSAPKKVLERVKRYIDEVGLSDKDKDTLWCVIDVDRWPREQIEELAEYCSYHPNMYVLISNPCFEVWLLYHKLRSLQDVDCSTAQQTKSSLHSLENGGYCYLNYIPLMETAVVNARAVDSNPDHHFPGHKETKVYLLADAILKRIGKVRFQRLIDEYLPRLR